MPKIKVRKSIAGRVRITKNGKLKRTRPGRRHLLAKKTAKRKRHLRKSTLVSTAQEKMYLRTLGKR